MTKRKKKTTFERLSGMNRQQRKELQRRLYSGDPGLEVVHPDAAGIDIGNDSHFVAVAPSRDGQPVREFGSWTADLEKMAEWLKACGIRTVAMQSTGVYWFAVQDTLERHGLEVFLVNARHTRNLPGRKTDVQESQWLLKLHTYGLLRNSFRPPEEIRKLRNIWRLRDRHVGESARAVQHIQKALISMNVRLANAISDISGTSGMAIIRAMLRGERDPIKLAALRDRRVRATEKEVALSLEGVWQDDHLFELEQAVDMYDFQQKLLAGCDRKLESYLAALPAREIAAADKQAAPEEEPVVTGESTDGKKRKRKRNKGKRTSGNAPKSFDLRAELKRVCGVDLTRVDGLDVMVVQTVIAEVGPDLGSRFASEGHFTSWLRACPRPDISGGKVIRQTREPSSGRIMKGLRMAASSLLRSDSHLGAKYRHLRIRLGAPKAIKAMARQLACIIYRLLTKGHAFVDAGAEQFELKRKEHELARLKARANSMGLQVVPIPA